jgi:hypothetical protein
MMITSHETSFIARPHRPRLGRLGLLVLAAPLAQAGCPVGDDFMWILPHALHVPMVIDPDGVLSPMSPNSTQATTMVVHHAGVQHKTTRYAFEAP